MPASEDVAFPANGTLVGSAAKADERALSGLLRLERKFSPPYHRVQELKVPRPRREADKPRDRYEGIVAVGCSLDPPDGTACTDEFESLDAVEVLNDEATDPPLLASVGRHRSTPREAMG